MNRDHWDPTFLQVWSRVRKLHIISCILWKREDALEDGAQSPGEPWIREALPQKRTSPAPRIGVMLARSSVDQWLLRVSGHSPFRIQVSSVVNLSLLITVYGWVWLLRWQVSQSRRVVTKALHLEASSASRTDTYHEIRNFKPNAMKGRYSESPVGEGVWEEC